MTASPAATADREPSTTTPALEIRGLTVRIEHGDDSHEVLHEVDLTVLPGEAVGVVGESGSGKSMTALAVMGLLPPTAVVTSGQIFFDGRDLLTLRRRQLREVRGGGVSMVLQDPVTALDPSFTVGHQIGESLRLHRALRGDALRREAIDLLDKVRIPSAEKRLYQYPHELSGGMRQRVCSAIALAGQPKVLLADEPTTALDVTTQAQYLNMLQELQAETGFALVLITHDLGIVRQMCESLVVMYAGQVIETGRPIDAVIDDPNHPYTRALFTTLPTLDPDADLRPIEGQMPSPAHLPPGCRFGPRCPHAQPVCDRVAPPLSARPGRGRYARCHGTSDRGWITSW